MNAKEQILKETFNLLLLKGFDAVSITDIQVETKLSRGLLYHYFKNKEDLFIQVTEKYFVKIFDFDIRKTKEYTVYQFTDFICQRFEKIDNTIIDIASQKNNSINFSMLGYHFLFYQVMQKDAIFRNNYRTTTEKERLGWEFALKKSILNNEIRADVEIESSAKQLFTLTDGIWFESMFSDKGDSIVKNLKKSLLHYIELLK